MSFQPPTAADLDELSLRWGVRLDPAAAARLSRWLTPFAAGFQALDALPDGIAPLKYPERSYRAPTATENGHGGWLVKTSIQGAADGPLAGRTVAIKDNIFVAGVPMADGTHFLEGFVPEIDATVVTRLLDAGARITGKAVCEFLCVSGGSATAHSGVVHNPHRRGYTAGGSSSGSAAIVGAGDADMALGCDQAGSIRIPASASGIYGMKATHGLVPYTGILGMEESIDHVGPMTANVADNALMLEVIAGADGVDLRQRSPVVHRYTAALGQSVTGLRIGVVREGFGHPLGERVVDGCVRAGAERLARMGAVVEDISIPEHPTALSIWGGVVTDGLWATLKFSGTMVHQRGTNSIALHRHMRGWLARLAEFPVNVQMLLLLGAHLERYGGYYYAKAKNLVPWVRAAYDRALGDYDLLLMPTLVGRPRALPDPRAADFEDETVYQAFNTIFNTCPFDVTGHPAMSVPCALRDDLPIGLMLVGRPHAEPTIYRAAHAFEQSGSWRSM